MSDKDKVVTVATRGVFLELLTVLFIGLKLTGYINWSWWWVLSPLWIPFLIALVILCLVLVVVFIGKL